MVDEAGVGSDAVYVLVTRAYPFKDYKTEEYEELIEFLRQIGLIKKEGKTVEEDWKRTKILLREPWYDKR